MLLREMSLIWRYASPALQTVSQREAMPPCAHVTLALVELMTLMSHSPAWVSMCKYNYHSIADVYTKTVEGTISKLLPCK